jgi:hypothetical protein
MTRGMPNRRAVPVNGRIIKALDGQAGSRKQGRCGPGTGGFPDNTGDLQAIYRIRPSACLSLRSGAEGRASRRMGRPPMVRDARLRDAPHHEGSRRAAARNAKPGGRCRPRRSGYPICALKNRSRASPRSARNSDCGFSPITFWACWQKSGCQESTCRGSAELCGPQATLPALRGCDRSRAICAAGCGAPNR